VYGPCTNLLLANGIAVTSHAGVVQAHFDFVDARGFHCMIDTIQPIDSLRMQRDLRKKRESIGQPRPTAQQAPPSPRAGEGARH
jgi:hypothetical protein